MSAFAKRKKSLGTNCFIFPQGEVKWVAIDFQEKTKRNFKKQTSNNFTKEIFDFIYGVVDVVLLAAIS
jgi:predicted secreted protein